MLLTLDITNASYVLCYDMFLHLLCLEFVGSSVLVPKSNEEFSSSYSWTEAFLVDILSLFQEVRFPPQSLCISDFLFDGLKFWKGSKF